MTITGRQLREARKLLRWTVAMTTRKTSVSQNLIAAVESGDGPAWLTDEQEAAIRCACEGAGIEFGVEGRTPFSVRWRTGTV